MSLGSLLVPVALALVGPLDMRCQFTEGSIQRVIHNVQQKGIYLCYKLCERCHHFILLFSSFVFITIYFTSIFIPFYCSTFTFQHYLFNTYYSALFFVNLLFSTICCFIKTFQHYLFYIYFLALFVSIYFLALFVSIYFLALFISKFTFSTICL